MCRDRQRAGGLFCLAHPHPPTPLFPAHTQLADLMEAASAQPHVLSVLLAAEQGYANAPLLVQAVAATVKMGHAQLAKEQASEEEEEEAIAEPATVARLGALLQKMSVPPEVSTRSPTRAGLAVDRVCARASPHSPTPNNTHTHAGVVRGLRAAGRGGQGGAAEDRGRQLMAQMNDRERPGNGCGSRMWGLSVW